MTSVIVAMVPLTLILGLCQVDTAAMSAKVVRWLSDSVHLNWRGVDTRQDVPVTTDGGVFRHELMALVSLVLIVRLLVVGLLIVGLLVLRLLVLSYLVLGVLRGSFGAKS